MVEAVDFLHKNKIVHRNLHPNNMLVRYDKNASVYYNSDLIIADCCAPTVMKDSLTKTRFKENSTCFMAPEIIDGQTFDYKSDIWSLGAIILDVSTTLHYFVRVLFFETKHFTLCL